MSRLPSLGLGIITYNSKDKIDACLETILAAAESLEEFQLVIVDNGSPDGTGDYLKDKYGTRFRIICRDNCGFAGGVNTLARALDGDILCICNPDLTLEKNALTMGLQLFVDDPKVGVCGANLLNSEGESALVYGNLPTPWNFFWHFSGLRRLWANPNWDLGRGVHSGQTAPFEVGYPTGAMWMIRKEAWEAVGPFDERYFLYFEETDWAFRCHTTDWKVMTHPGIGGMHEVGGSTEKDDDSQIQMWTRFFRSGFQFLAKHYGVGKARSTYGRLRRFGAAKNAVLSVKKNSPSVKSQFLIQSALKNIAGFVWGDELSASQELILRDPHPAESD